MLKFASAFALGLLLCQPAFADGVETVRPRYYHYGYGLPAERHVIEIVSPPYSANFIINGARFTGMSRACYGWTAGEPIRLISGDWNARCASAVFYNYTRRNRCQMLCGSGGWGGWGGWGW
jgi:hypothetical protein